MAKKKCKHPLDRRVVIRSAYIDEEDGDDITGEVCLDCHAYRFRLGTASTTTIVLGVRVYKWKHPK